MSNDYLSKYNLDLLKPRINILYDTQATDNLFKIIYDLSNKKGIEPLKILVVGCGGSYPAAIFAKYAISENLLTSHIDVATPQSALKILTQFDKFNPEDINPYYDFVIGISYSGKTPDIKAVYDVCEKKKLHFILLTGEKKSSLYNLYSENNYMDIISYYKDIINYKENSMISIFSTIAPMLILDDTTLSYIQKDTVKWAFKDSKEFISKLDLNSISNSIRKSPVIHVFYEWDTYAAAVDIESKFTESGIANVVLHEKKDFSHGRVTLLLRQEFGLIINLVRYDKNKSYLAYTCEYDKELSNYLKNTCDLKECPYLEIGNKSISATKWNITSFILIAHLTVHLGISLNIDVSKHYKPFPKEAIYLYDYTGKLY